MTEFVWITVVFLLAGGIIYLYYRFIDCWRRKECPIKYRNTENTSRTRDKDIVHPRYNSLSENGSLSKNSVKNKGANQKKVRFNLMPTIWTYEKY